MEDDGYGNEIGVPAGVGRVLLLLVLALALVVSWGADSRAQTPADAQYGSPTETASGNPSASGGNDNPASATSDDLTSDDPASEDPASATSDDPTSDDSASEDPASATGEDLVSEASGMLGVALGLLAAIAGLSAALYAVSRVRPGLSLHLQRRALVFLALVGLFFAVTQLLYALGELRASSGEPGTYLALGHFVAAAAVVVCLVAAGYLLRRSELVEIGALRRSADIDALTALYNQPFFRRAASRRIAQAERHGVPLSLAMIDVDDFKTYNDRFGHESGNTVLRRVAGVLRRSVRADDVVARYGGEEFVMLLNSQPGEAEDALERIRALIAARCSPDAQVRRQITVSIGIAALAEGTRTLEGLIEAADEAMYRAKRAGKNRVVAWREAS